MSDDRLLELKRAWERSKAAADEAAYLQERVRVGELTPAQLELAAYCGHEAARLAVGDAGANDDLKFTVSWLKPIFRHSISISTKAALVLALVKIRALAWVEESQQVVEALEAWLEDRSDENTARIRAEIEAVFAVADDADLPEARAAVQELAAAAAIAEGHRWNELPHTLNDIPPPKILRAIREAIRDELAPWVLEQPGL